MAQDTIKIKVEIDDNNATTNLKNVKENLKLINVELQKVDIGSDRYKELTQEASKFNTILKESKTNAKSINAVEGSLQSMKNELKLSIQELKKLEQGSDAYDKLIKKIQKLNFEIKEAGDELKDFNFMQGVIGDFTEFAGSLTKITGGLAQMGLQGNESLDSIIKTMSKVQGTLLALEGVQKLQVATIKMWGSSLAVLEKGYDKLIGVFKKGIGSIGLFMAAISALVIVGKLLYDWFKNSESQVKSYQKAIDGTVIKNDELRKSHNEHITSMKKLSNEIDVLTGAMTKQQAALSNLRADYNLKLKEIEDDLAKSLEKQTSFWGVLLGLFDDDVKELNKAFDKYRKDRDKENDKSEAERKKIKLQEDAEEIKRLVSTQQQNLDIEKKKEEQLLIIKKRGYVNVYNLISLEEAKNGQLIKNSISAEEKFRNRSLVEEEKAQKVQTAKLYEISRDLQIKKIALEEATKKTLISLESRSQDSLINLLDDGVEKNVELAEKRRDDTIRSLKEEIKATLLNVVDGSVEAQKIRNYYNDIILNTEKKTQEELTKIQEDEIDRRLSLVESYNKRVIDLNNLKLDEIINIYNKELKEVENNNIKQIQHINTLIQTKQISEKDGAEKIYNIRKQFNQNILDDNIKAFNETKKLNDKSIKNEENRLKELDGIIDQKEIDRINKKYDKIKTNIDNELNLYKDGNDKYLKANEDKNNLEIEQNQSKEDEIIDQYKKRAEAFKKIQEETFNLSNQATDAYYQAQDEKRAYDLDASNAKLNDKYNTEKRMLDDNLKNGNINQNKYDKTLKKKKKKKRQDERKLKEDNWKSEQEQKKSMIYTDTAIGIVKAIALSAPNFIQGAIAAAAVAASSAIQLSVINKQKMPKFEYGGMVGGQHHSNGGTIIEAEKGEYIVNKKAMQNADNKAVVTAVNNNQPIAIIVDENQLRKIVSEIISIPVTVLESDITKSQRKVKLLNNNSNL